MSGFPERGVDLGELPGMKSPGNLWIALKIRNGRSSREVVEELPGKFGNFREVQELSRSSGGP